VEHRVWLAIAASFAVGINAPVCLQRSCCQEVSLAPAAEPSSAGELAMPALRRMLPAHDRDGGLTISRAGTHPT